MLAGARDIPLIEDDIYGDLHFGPERPRSCKAFDTTGNVLLCGSFSKTLAPGFRVGYVAPGRFRERVELLKFSHTVATATLPQYGDCALPPEGRLRQAPARPAPPARRAGGAHGRGRGASTSPRARA